MPRLVVFYHFFHPDDVVSSRHFSEFAEEQARRGWQVTAVTSNRACRDVEVRYPPRDEWRGVSIHRSYRPGWNQARPLLRLANSAWMIASWAVHSLRLGDQDALVIGSDPAFAPLLAIPLRRLRPRNPIVHWCYDLYPEAIEAEGGPSRLAGPARALMAQAYRSCDAVVDLGACMRARLDRYRHPARRETLVPWALVEPSAPAGPDPEVRAQLFGAARLGLLYAGTMGRAHDFELFLELARRCRQRSGGAIGVCFACRGNRFAELRAAIRPEDGNVTLAPFADESALQKRLEAADVHLLSLRAEWAGIVVPSKFFGSLAVGRPVIYAGPAESSIAGWVRRDDTGLHLTADTLDAVTDRLHRLLEDRRDLERWQSNAFRVYGQEFSKRVVNDRWDLLLRQLVAARQA